MKDFHHSGCLCSIEIEIRNEICFVVIAPQFFFFHHSKVLIAMFDQNELSFHMVGLSLNTCKAYINLIMMN